MPTRPMPATSSASSHESRRSLLEQVGDVWGQWKAKTAAEFFRWAISPQAPFVVQFLKYGFCGGLAFLSHNGVVWILARTVYPAFEGNGLSIDQLSINQAWSNVWGMMLSNIVAYVTNILFVFQGGRHSRLKEFGLFSAVNLVSGTVGLMAGPYLRSHFHTSFIVAQLSLIVSSALMNFVCRKYFVFSR